MSPLRVCAAADLPPGALRARGPVFAARLADGRLVAYDKACPHQGYPLSQGSVCEGVLTCAWHNWKFSLETGEARLGEEGLRPQRVWEEDGAIFVARDETVDLAAAWAGLRDALAEGQVGRLGRELGRLRMGGVPARALLVHLAVWDADHAEWGPGHPVALAAACLPWLDAPPPGVDPEVHALQLLVEVGALVIEGVARRPARPLPAPLPPPADLHAALAAAVEGERAAEAEALVRGLVEAGADQAALTAALAPLLADHFVNFGHHLIFLEAALCLAEGAPPADQAALLGGWVFGLTQGTREDLLPPWAGHRKRRAAWGDAGAARAAANPRREGVPTADDHVSGVALEEALLRGSPAAAFTALAAALERQPWAVVIDALVRAGAAALLRFEAAHDADPEVDAGWLDLTHRFTVPVGLRWAARALPPEAFAALALQLGHFLALGQPMCAPGGPPAPAPLDPAAARAEAGALLAHLLTDQAARPIFFAHDLKVLNAALDESLRLGDALPLQAARRYLEAHRQERSARQVAVEALRLLREGKPPRTIEREG
ncbi:MAG: hypothetical protein RL071_689 [Pseudomonadota bacterium]